MIQLSLKLNPDLVHKPYIGLDASIRKYFLLCFAIVEFLSMHYGYSCLYATVG